MWGGVILTCIKRFGVSNLLNWLRHLFGGPTTNATNAKDNKEAAAAPTRWQIIAWLCLALAVTIGLLQSAFSSHRYLCTYSFYQLVVSEKACDFRSVPVYFQAASVAKIINQNLLQDVPKVQALVNWRVEASNYAAYFRHSDLENAELLFNHFTQFSQACMSSVKSMYKLAHRTKSLTSNVEHYLKAARQKLQAVYIDEQKTGVLTAIAPHAVSNINWKSHEAITRELRLMLVAVNELIDQFQWADVELHSAENQVDQAKIAEWKKLQTLFGLFKFNLFTAHTLQKAKTFIQTSKDTLTTLQAQLLGFEAAMNQFSSNIVVAISSSDFQDQFRIMQDAMDELHAAGKAADKLRELSSSTDQPSSWATRVKKLFSLAAGGLLLKKAAGI